MLMRRWQVACVIFLASCVWFGVVLENYTTFGDDLAHVGIDIFIVTTAVLGCIAWKNGSRSSERNDIGNARLATLIVGAAMVGSTAGHAHSPIRFILPLLIAVVTVYLGFLRSFPKGLDE